MQTLDQHQAFDFEFGDWTVSHRRLKLRMQNSDAWESFAGTASVRPILNGFGNLEDNLIDFLGDPYRAIALRSYDPQTGNWAIWWLDGRAPHRLDVPVIGRFTDGIGTFYADDMFEGRPIRVRFRWLDTDTPSPRWEQAFSADGGTSWETNWVMRFERVRPT
jgi:hypothetical protein